MAKQKIKELFEQYDTQQLGVCSHEQVLSLLTAVEVQEAEALAVLGHLSQAHDGQVHYGELLDLLFGEDAPLPEHAHHEEVKDDPASDQEVTTQQQAPDETDSGKQRRSKRRTEKLGSQKFLSGLKEVAHDIDFRYDFLIMGKASSVLQLDLERQPNEEGVWQPHAQQPLSLHCSVFTPAPSDFSADLLEHYLQSSTCWGEEVKGAKIRIHKCRDKRDDVPRLETRAEADAAAAIFVLSLPAALDAEAAELSLAKEISSLKRMAGQYFEQQAHLIASLTCLLVFGTPPLPAEATRFAEEHGLAVAILPSDVDLQILMSRLASLLPAAAEVKERRLQVEQAAAKEQPTTLNEEAVKRFSLPPRDQFGTCLFSKR